MKHLLTIMVILIALTAAHAQTKPLIKRDTLLMLLKVADTATNSRDTIVTYKWIEGYAVTSTEPIYINGVLCRCFKFRTIYLYLDKKPVTQKVIYAIKR